MPRKMIYLLSVLCPAVLAGCSQDLDLPEVGGKPKIVLLGELTAGEPLLLRGGKSAPMANGSKAAVGFPADLSLTVEDDGGGTTVLTGQYDDYSTNLHTLSYSGGPVRSGTTYRLRATDPEMGEARVEVVIPAPFNATVTAFNRSTYAGDSVMRFVVRIRDNGGERNHYSIEALREAIWISGAFFHQGQWQQIDANRPLYDSLKRAGAAITTNFDTTYTNRFSRQLLYTPDVAAENVKTGNTLQKLRRALLTDEVFNGNDYEVEIFVRTEFFRAVENTSDKGRILIQVKAISAAYFDYLRSYENFDAESGFGFGNNSQPVKIPGNVTNGLGVVGGAYKVQQAFVYDDWGY